MLIKILISTFMLFMSISTESSAGMSQFIEENTNYITPSISSQNCPVIQKRHSGNNLRRKYASPYIAKGEFVLIEGFVTDVVGNPIHNAAVVLYQANAMGYYNHDVFNKTDTSMYDPDFTGSGTTTTDGNGYYSFITIIPGFTKNMAPHFHIKVTHEYFETINTVFWLPNHPRNEDDELYQALNEAEKNLLTCQIEPYFQDDESASSFSKKIFFNVRFSGIHPYRRV